MHRFSTSYRSSFRLCRLIACFLVLSSSITSPYCRISSVFSIGRRSTPSVRQPWFLKPTICQALMTCESMTRSQVLVHAMAASPCSPRYSKMAACPGPPFHISMVRSMGIASAASPATLSMPLISPESRLESRYCDVSVRDRKSVQVHSRLYARKKSLASTRNDAERFSKPMLLFAKAVPTKGFGVRDDASCAEPSSAENAAFPSS